MQILGKHFQNTYKNMENSGMFIFDRIMENSYFPKKSLDDSRWIFEMYSEKL